MARADGECAHCRELKFYHERSGLKIFWVLQEWFYKLKIMQPKNMKDMYVKANSYEIIKEHKIKKRENY